MSGIARTRTEIACFNPHRIITIIIIVVVVVVMTSVKVYLAMYSEYMCESGERRIRVNYEPCTCCTGTITIASSILIGF